MDLRQLKYFYAVARYESLTAASEALNVTQPAIGQQVRKLEEGLGLKLLSRHSRGMRLTPVGKILYRRAQEILSAVERTERELARHRDTNEGTVRIGVTPSLSRVMVPRLMEVGFDRYPGVTLLFHQGFPTDLERMWEAGDCDFAFVQSDIETEESESLPLYNERLCLIGAPNLCRNFPNPVPVTDIAGLPLVLDIRSFWLREQLDNEFKRLKLAWKDVIESSSIEIRREYLLQQQRFCIAPLAQFIQEVEAGLVEIRDIDLESFNRTVFLAGPRVEMMTEAEKGVRDLIVEITDGLIEDGTVGLEAPDWHS